MANLVLLHGLGANGRVWDTWPDTKYAPDLPGHGSATPLSTYTFDAELHALHHRAVTLPGLGHNAQVEDPAAVAALLR